MIRLRSFTIIEMMVAMVIGSFALVFAAYGYRTANQWYHTITHNIEVESRQYLLFSDLERTFKNPSSTVTSEALVSGDTKFTLYDNSVVRDNGLVTDTFGTMSISFSEQELENETQLNLTVDSQTFHFRKLVGASAQLNAEVFGTD